MSQKYPKTWHLPYSEKVFSDDRKHETDDIFVGKNVVVTIKLDGENSTLYNDHYHARSLDSRIDSEDRRWLEAFRISKVSGKIPENFRICGENMFYKHTCFYNNLKSMFYVFSIWDGNLCLSWNDTIKWCNKLGLLTVPVIYNGQYNKSDILSSFKNYCKSGEDVEGFVISNADEFYIDEFKDNISKYVNSNFVIGSKNWRHDKKIKNELCNGENPWNII